MFFIWVPLSQERVETPSPLIKRLFVKPQSIWATTRVFADLLGFAFSLVVELDRVVVTSGCGLLTVVDGREAVFDIEAGLL